MADYDHRGFKLYHYDPSMAAAVIFIVFFAPTTTLHLYQLISTRTWYLIPMVIGGLFETIGYVGRVLSSRQSPDWTLTPYIIQSLLLLLAPALFAASIYMELGRIIQVVKGEAHCFIRLRWLTKIFVAGDVLSFLIQSSGGGLMAKSGGSSMKLGSNIIVGGLIIQLLFFGFFIVVAVAFDRSIRRRPTPCSISPEIPWYRYLQALYAASALIMIRSVFRVVEYVQGNDGYLLAHEVFLYIFDAVLMLGVMVVFNFLHPSEIKALLRGGKMFKNGCRMYTLDSSRF